MFSNYNGKVEYSPDISPRESDIESILKKSKHVLVVGYSPTGGGHTARTFSIIDQACRDGHLVKGDVVVIHCPPAWGKAQNRELDNITKRLNERNIHVVLTANDKSVYGYLKPEGSSDDPSILAGFANYPKRQVKSSSIIQSGVIWSGKEEMKPIDLITDAMKRDDITITATDLMKSLTHIVEDKHKIFVLTDMDPYLQKAAIKEGVPKEQCLDQQNHAILLGTNPSLSEALNSTNAFLAKVLCGSGGLVSHIGLGEKNSLQSAVQSAKVLGIENPEKITMGEVKNNFTTLLREKGKKLPLDQPYKESKPGVMWPPNLKQEDVEQVVYIYAHNYTPAIGEHIRQRISNNDPNYKNKVFLFCGANAIEGSYNVLHLSYIAGADGITTAGAGTNGEYAYLKRFAGSPSNLLIVPITNHNEQEKNAEALKEEFGSSVLVCKSLAVLSFELDSLMQKKSSPGMQHENMEKMMSAISNPQTYASQASDLLFSPNSENKKVFQKIQEIEVKMQQDPVLKANRRYIKAVFQILEQMREKIKNKSNDIFPIEIKLTQHDKEIVFHDLKAIAKFFEPEHLNKFLDVPEKLGTEEKSESIVMHRDVYSLFKQCAEGQTLPTESDINEIEDKIGERFTTGF